jgi:hypothetical protein
MTRLRATAGAVALGLSLAARGAAQDLPDHEEHAHHHEMPAPDTGWTWAGDANVFFGYNYQQRKYQDETAWESQNWLMGSGAKRLGGGRLELSAMMSLEPFTMHAQGRRSCSRPVRPIRACRW